MHLPAAISRCEHRPRLSCCGQLPAAGQEAYSSQREQDRGRQLFSLSRLHFSSSFLSLRPSSFPLLCIFFVFILILPSLLLFLSLSQFPLYHLSSPETSAPALVYYWTHGNEVTLNQYKSISISYQCHDNEQLCPFLLKAVVSLNGHELATRRSSAQGDTRFHKGNTILVPWFHGWPSIKII